MDARRTRAIFERLRAANPHPTTELNYRTPFELLVAVILSAQATDKSVNLATAKLFERANTPAAIVGLGIAGLSDYIKTIGLFNTKAKNIVEASRLIVERHGGEVPRDRAALEALPGVGRKTANVILNTAFGEPTIAVDTHIFRVAIAPGSRAARTSVPWKKNSSRPCRRTFARMRTTGSSCTDATCARRAGQIARPASSGSCAPSGRKLRLCADPRARAPFSSGRA